MTPEDLNKRIFSSISDLSDLAKFLHVGPRELNYLLCRLDRQYSHRTRRKPDGSKRDLFVPSDKLKLLQRKINEHVLSRAPLLSCVFGGVRRKSVVDNASVHCGKEVVFKMDLQQCFPSVGCARVRAVFQSLGFRPEIVAVLTKLTTWRDELPQGVPTSTALANLALTRVDGRITVLQAHHDFDYTRWVDDLTFSGDHRLKRLRNLLRRIVEDEGFRVKEEKTKTMLHHEPQLVTNLVVNEKVNLPRPNRAAIKKEVIQAVAGGQAFNPRLAGKVHWYRSVNVDAGNRLLKRVLNYAETH